MATIIEVAKHCGVSFKSVSNVINKHPNVSDKLRSKVLAAIEELNYSPSESARALVSHKKNAKKSFAKNNKYQIGCVVSADINKYGNPFYLSIFHGIEEEINRQNHVLAFIQSDQPLLDDPLLYNYFLDQDRIHGVISFNRYDTIMKRLEKFFPSVTVGENSIGADYITPDLEHGTFIALDYLLKLGHTKIAFIGVKHPTKCSKTKRPRFKAFLEWIANNKLTCRDEWIYDCGFFSQENGEIAVNSILTAEDERPTAIFCASDEIAYGVLKGLKQRGMIVPKDISVIGFDNLSTSDLISPGLTTIDISGKEIGRKVAMMMINRLKHPDAPQDIQVQSANLIERKSCAEVCQN